MPLAFRVELHLALFAFQFAGARSLRWQAPVVQQMVVARRQLVERLMTLVAFKRAVVTGHDVRPMPSLVTVEFGGVTKFLGTLITAIDFDGLFVLVRLMQANISFRCEFLFTYRTTELLFFHTFWCGFLSCLLRLLLFVHAGWRR